MPYDPTYHLLWRPDKIREAIRAACPDVVEIHSPYVAALGVLAAKRGSFGIRTFVWHSDFIDTYERVLVEDLLGRWGAERHRSRLRPAARALGVPLWAWVRTIARGCAATFCASAWQASKLARHGVSAERLPFGVDKELFRPRARAGGDAPTLVASGRLAIEKRWDTVLEGFARFAARSPGARLVVYGDGPERARLEKLASKNVYFAGFERDRQKLAAAIASADALVHGCPHETFGIAVAEAIAAGVPVVVPDEGGAAELAKPEFSETFRAGDAEACAAAIERLLARAPRAREAAARAGANILSTREHFERLLARYEALLGEARRGRA